MTVADPTKVTEEAIKPYIFHYDKEEAGEKSKTVSLARTDYGNMHVHVCKIGGEDALHAHPHTDGFWFVLKGAARFYTVNDRLVADLHENEGMLAPRGFPYWFEAAPNENNEDLELLRCYIRDLDYHQGDTLRINYEPPKPSQGTDTFFGSDAINAYEESPGQSSS